MKTSRKFATSPDILVAKGKNSVANATMLVAISSPELQCNFLIAPCTIAHFRVAACLSFKTSPGAQPFK